jgi:hypothetical protein
LYINSYKGRRLTKKIENQLPTLPRTLSIAILIASLILVVTGIFLLTNSKIFGVAFVIVSVFLFLKKRWAFEASGPLLVLMALLIPFGLFDPFSATELENSGEKIISFNQRVILFISSEMILLFILFIFSRYRKLIHKHNK